MTLFDILYTIFIGPLELLYDVVYTLFYYVTSNPGLSIAALSIFINVLLLPLYNRADKIQEEAKNIENKLKPGVDHIKKYFKGDEQYMLIQTYYRQNNYKPYYSLKGLLPLLLEIPFFIAAYNYLSNLSILEGASFFIIDNLKQPDGLLNGINLLPILMTIINIISSSIYTKGDSLKAKIQLYGMALIFLVLLYNSPSGLVMYWTLNNLFSLIKNILVKLDNCNLIVSILCSVISILGIIFIVFIHPLATLIQTVGVCVGLLLLQLPIIFYLLNKKKVIKQDKEIKVDNKIFYLSCLFLCVLTGLLIPTTLIGSSPSEFIDTNTLKNPLWYILNCFCLSLGTFVIWFNVYYALLDKKIKKIICPIIFSICIIAVVDYMLFGTNLGNLSNQLIFDDQPIHTIKEMLINTFSLLGSIGIVVVLFYKKNNFINRIIAVMLCTLICLSSINVIKISNSVENTITILKENSENIDINLSKNGKNVILIMLDREVTYFVPFMLEEKPELIKQFSGFTYYPNTLAFGNHTKIGAPPLFGGYEYVPVETNRRNNIRMEEKHDEALKVLPILFSNKGYQVTVSDLPYAGGYGNEIPDMSIFDEYPDINAFLMDGVVANDASISGVSNLDKLNRNLFCYSIMKICPVFIQNIIYNYGYYNNAERMEKELSAVGSYYQSYGISDNFMKPYSVLANLSNNTSISDDNKNTLFMMNNNTSHSYQILQKPNYEPKIEVNNKEYEKEHEIRRSIYGKELTIDDRNEMAHYDVCMASLIQLGKWFDYLKENDIYDNTRIVVVSDHGYKIGEEDMIYSNVDLNYFISFLMIKDFNSSEFKIDDSFMTNADVPTIVTDGLIDDPQNPFTGNHIDSNYKNDNDLYILYDESRKANEYTHVNTGIWLKFDGDNVYDFSNWFFENPSN